VRLGCQFTLSRLRARAWRGVCVVRPQWCAGACYPARPPLTALRFLAQDERGGEQPVQHHGDRCGGRRAGLLMQACRPASPCSEGRCMACRKQGRTAARCTFQHNSLQLTGCAGACSCRPWGQLRGLDLQPWQIARGASAAAPRAGSQSPRAPRRSGPTWPTAWTWSQRTTGGGRSACTARRAALGSCWSM